MDRQEEINHIGLEIIGMQNPLQISMPNYSSIYAIEVQQFHYVPTGTPPTGYLGINVSGTRGRYNQYGLQMDTVKTIPLAPSNIYDYQSSEIEGGTVHSVNNGTDITITFIDKTINSLNHTLINFNNNYLLNLALYLK